jgi:hypothetical protein
MKRSRPLVRLFSGSSSAKRLHLVKSRLCRGEIFGTHPQMKSSVSRSVKSNPSLIRRSGFHCEVISFAAGEFHPSERTDLIENSKFHNLLSDR